MLSPLDDYPVHQVAEPIRNVATSDRNFYDRYYFNMHGCSGELFLVAGMGQYPNLGVQDAFVAVLHDGIQRVVRASRELGADRMDTRVGPIRVEILEGLRRLRVVCEPNESGIELDATWNGAIHPFQEPRHYRRQLERITFDTMRMAQTGHWTGTLRLLDQTFDLTPDRWWGTRDRSWGVRPVGEPEPPGIASSKEPSGFFWNYAPMQFRDYSILYIVQEEPDGARLMEEAVRVHPLGSDRPPEPLGHPDHELEFAPGTRTITRATLHFEEPDGKGLRVVVDPLLPMYLGMGTGYGMESDWRHGMYQGPLVVQGVSYDTAKDQMWGLVDSVARFETDGGDVGYGLWEYAVFGPHQRYGFKGWEDMGL
jgi:hypothetical protein